jgi:hypothetical protein
VTGNVLLTSRSDKGRGFGYYLNAVEALDGKGWKRKRTLFIPMVRLM